MVLCFLLSIFCSNSTADRFSGSFELLKEARALNAEYFKRIGFELAKEQMPRGDEEKYVLQGSDGNYYLFKIQGEDGEKRVEEAASWWAKFCGISAPVVSRIKLPINGKWIEGTIQKLLIDVTSLQEIEIEKLSKFQLTSILNHQIIDWLLSSYDVDKDEFLLEKNSGVIHGVDKDDAFQAREGRNENLFLGIDIVGEPYAFIWKSYVEEKLTFNINNLFDLVDYIQGIDGTICLEIFQSVFDARQNWQKEFFMRKAALRDYLEQCYGSFSKKRSKLDAKVPLHNKRRVNKLSAKIARGIKREVRNRKQELSRLKPVPPETERKNIRVIASGDIWRLVDEFINEDESPKENRAVFSITVEEIDLRRQKIDSLEELLALELYVCQIQESLEGEGFRSRRRIERVTLHPESSEVFEMLSKKDFKRERQEYLYSLAYAVRKEFDKAIMYAEEAEEHGLKIPEILKKKLSVYR